MRVPTPPSFPPIATPADIGLVVRSLVQYLKSLKVSVEGASAISQGVAWTPGTIADGAMVSTSVTVRGALLGMPVTVAFSLSLVAGVLLGAHITATDTVQVTLFNKSGGAVTPGAGTLRVDVWT